MKTKKFVPKLKFIFCCSKIPVFDKKDKTKKRTIDFKNDSK